MSFNALVVTVEATHQSLDQRLREARQGDRAGRGGGRDRFPRTDAFMSGASRHLAAVEEVLVAEARHLPEVRPTVSSYLHEARSLEHAIAILKARLYGEAHAAHLTWSHVWDEVAAALQRHNALERRLVQEVVGALGETRSTALAERVYRAELKAPTRAHPYIPHNGRLGHVARRVWALADRFWDTAEGRSVPLPVRPKPREHRHDSLMGQYLVGEPQFDADAPIFAHRRHEDPGSPDSPESQASPERSEP